MFVFGVQVYDVTLLAVSVTLPVSPMHTSVVFALNETLGNGSTFTTTVSCEEQPKPAVPTTVYVVVADGEAETVPPVVCTKPFEGVHVKFAAPTAVSVADTVLQIE